MAYACRCGRVLRRVAFDVRGALMRESCCGEES